MKKRLTIGAGAGVTANQMEGLAIIIREGELALFKEQGNREVRWLIINARGFIIYSACKVTKGGVSS